MRRRYSRLAAATTALAAAVLAALALRPSSKPAVNLAARNPTVEVRTVVIRRTIHIVKHERPVAAAPPNGGLAYHPSGPAPRTGTSGSRAAAPTAVATVSTRVSGSHPAGSSGGPAPVTTRTSAARGGSGGSGSAGTPVTTRTSASSGSGKPVSTRTSGSGGDGGDGSGSDN